MKILYVCTHNRCRSILSEAITNQKGRGLVTAVSAGSTPAEAPHPLTLKYLHEQGYSTKGLSSKSWYELSEPLDLVVTVCDSANAEDCPVWFGDSMRLHWGLNDPSKSAESAKSFDSDDKNSESAQQEIANQFLDTIDIIEKRVDKLLNLARLPKEKWQEALNELIAED